MKLKTQQLTATLAVAGAALLAADTDAATIAWEASVNMYQGSTDQGFVNNTGTTAVAYNNTTDLVSGDTNATLNGVTFTPQSAGVALVGGTGESITINGGTDNENAFGDGEFSGDGDIFHLIRGGTFNVNSVTLGGLQVGTEYLIQVFNNDARGNRHENFVTAYGDGSGSGQAGFSQLNNSPSDGSAPTFPETDAGDSIIGTFTADAATLTFNIYGRSNPANNFASGNSQSQINAIQLRVVPEPGSLALLGLGGLLIARRRRG